MHASMPLRRFVMHASMPLRRFVMHASILLRRSPYSTGGTTQQCVCRPSGVTHVISALTFGVRRGPAAQVISRSLTGH